jgi:uncharacterized protein (TIGR00270 family)
MECEICGAKSNALYEVIFQGRRVFACKKCIEHYGLSIIRKRSNITKMRRQPMRKRAVLRRNLLSEPAEEIVEGYGEIIEKARERLGLTQEDIA